MHHKEENKPKSQDKPNDKKIMRLVVHKYGNFFGSLLTDFTLVLWCRSNATFRFDYSSSLMHLIYYQVVHKTVFMLVQHQLHKTTNFSHTLAVVAPFHTFVLLIVFCPMFLVMMQINFAVERFVLNMHQIVSALTV